MEDHNPPLLSQIVGFLETAADFLEVRACVKLNAVTSVFDLCCG